MPYRSMTWTKPRFLVVRNEPVATAVIAGCTGFLMALTGCVLLTNLVLSPPGGEVVMSAVATVFVLAGATIATLGIRMDRCRTFLTIEREELTITVRTGGESSRHVVRVEDVERVGLEIDAVSRESTYRTQIIIRGGAAIALGEVKTSSRRHYERVVADIRHFLGGR